MKFAYLYYLYALPALLLAGYFLQRYSKKSAKKKLLLFSPSSRHSAILRTLDPQAKKRKMTFFIAGLSFLLLTLARPLLGPKADKADQKGAEFYFILDISNSMLVPDVAPNRLNAVIKSLDEWIKTRHGDRIGLILVAGDAFVQAPLTSDYTAYREVLKQSSPGAISLGGTNLPAAIVAVTKALKDTKQENKVVILISDGENLEGDAVKTIQEARKVMNQKITFHTVGVGTAQGGKVPEFHKNLKLESKLPHKNFVRDEYGVEVTSRLDERTLRSIAQVGGGKYYTFDPDGDTWEHLYTQNILPLTKKIDTLDFKDYTELFQVPLAIAILFFLFEFAISTRLKNPPKVRSVVSLPQPVQAPTASRVNVSKRKPAPKPTLRKK